MMAAFRSYIASPQDEGCRLDALLALKGIYQSRSLAARFIDGARVFVNGANVTKRYLVHAGDTIVYEEEEDPVALRLFGQPIALDIRYEDDHLLVLSKQAGLVCHPSVDHHDNTLVNALIYHCGRENLCNVQGADDRLGIVHRLDRDTTGLMLAAKTDEAGLALMEGIRQRTVERRYLALVHGNIVHETGMVDAPITRSPSERTKMAVRDTDSARDSITTFTVLERFEAAPKDDGFTLVDCKLFTGRTHQIRVHMLYIKHPCVGDPVYGGNPAATQLGLSRQFLHSYLLDFTHPTTGAPMHFTDKLPQDLQDALDSLSPRSTGRTKAGSTLFETFSAAD